MGRAKQRSFNIACAYYLSIKNMQTALKNTNLCNCQLFYAGNGKK